MKNTILFDLDGTLVNTFDDLADATNYAMEMTGNPIVPDHKMRKFIGDGVVSLVGCALGDNNQTDRKLAGSYFIDYYLSHLTYKTRPYEGIEELINKLKQEGYKLGVVTNKRHSAAVMIIDYFFPDKFHYVIGENKIIPRKPAPDMVLIALKELKARKEDCIFIGDSEIDFKTYIGAEITGITCLYGFCPENELLSLNPENFVHSAKELYDMIKSLS
ncbi:MAG: HAD-IA family hydrolase [Clostridia bacterium]|nr:HAD-IA family hydrolase [Clostridia bacterium]